MLFPNFELVKLLLTESNVNPNLETIWGENCYLAAFSSGYCDVTEALLEHKAGITGINFAEEFETILGILFDSFYKKTFAGQIEVFFKDNQKIFSGFRKIKQR